MKHFDASIYVLKKKEEYLTFILIGLLCDLLWSDPDPTVIGWSPNERGVSYVFGADVLAKFLQNMDLDIVVRGHQVNFEVSLLYL